MLLQISGMPEVVQFSLVTAVIILKGCSIIIDLIHQQKTLTIKRFIKEVTEKAAHFQNSLR